VPDRDYPDIVRIHNALFPDFAEDESERRYDDSYRDPSRVFQRVMATGGRDAILGYGEYFHMNSQFHPRKFVIDLYVAPEAQGTGVGRALYDHIVDALVPYDPLVLRAWTVEDMPRPLRFLADRGFVEESRVSESWLPVAPFDPAPFAGAEARVAAQGIAIRTLAELGPDDPEVRHKLYELSEAVAADMPAVEARTKTAYDLWIKRFEYPNLLTDAQFIALDGEDFVGVSTLWKRQIGPDLQTGVTGTLGSHRRRGIALALKLRAIAYAQASGTPIIRTDNDATNVGMLAINRALGFVPQPAWIGFAKVTGT
jgi:GNAT superfamily N-acetyltransferase